MSDKRITIFIEGMMAYSLIFARSRIVCIVQILVETAFGTMISDISYSVCVCSGIVDADRIGSEEIDMLRQGQNDFILDG